MKKNNIIRTAALTGALAVIIGAFGAHGLKPHFSDYQMDIYEKGVHYQFFHVLAMLGVGIYYQHKPSVWLKRAAWAFGIGILFFSGSLYLLACRDLLPFNVGWAGPITPLGGLSFIAGWGMLMMNDF